MEVQVGQWYYNAATSKFDEAWTRVTEVHKNKWGQGSNEVEWDTFVMRDGMYLVISHEELPEEVALDPETKIHKATGKELILLISRIFNYPIEEND